MRRHLASITLAAIFCAAFLYPLLVAFGPMTDTPAQSVAVTAQRPSQPLYRLARDDTPPIPPPTPVPALASTPKVSVPSATTSVPRPSSPVRVVGGASKGPVGSDALWFCIAQHESGGNWQTNTGNHFYGGLQFSQATWNAMHTGYARADLAPASVQIAAGRKAAEMGGLHNQFPRSSRACGG